MAHTEALQTTLSEELVARIEETDLAVPVKQGLWLYCGRSREGANHGIHCRRPVDGSQVGGQVSLNENVLAEGYDEFGLANAAVSPNHRWLNYATEVTGRARRRDHRSGPQR
jgi:oligopeptidase B